ncbi:MAG: prepilin peptidase [Eubacteriales bacterium]|nr:prepilin peptidase [Eubacteriales bacterium]
MLHIDPFLTTYILALAFITGAAIGSFINCMAYRVVNNESILKGRSHCAVCDHTLGAIDLIPIFSYIFLRAKCRYCGEKVAPRYLLIEIITALLFVLIVYRFDVSFLTLIYIVLVCILLGLSLVDLEIYEIPDRFIIAGTVWWAVTIPFAEMNWIEYIKDGLIGGFAIGGGMLLIALLFDKLTGKESLGGGDIKLFFMTGLYLGPLLGIFNVMLSCILGIVLVVFMKQNRIPFGPAISAATLISILAGDNAIAWYLNLL